MIILLFSLVYYGLFLLISYFANDTGCFIYEIHSEEVVGTYIDPIGNSYVYGYAYSSIANISFFGSKKPYYSKQPFVIKISEQGNVEWKWMVGGDKESALIHDFVVNQYEEVFLLLRVPFTEFNFTMNQFSNVTTQYPIAMVKISPEGTVRYSTLLAPEKGLGTPSLAIADERIHAFVSLNKTEINNLPPYSNLTSIYNDMRYTTLLNVNGSTGEIISGIVFGFSSIPQFAIDGDVLALYVNLPEPMTLTNWKIEKGDNIILGATNGTVTNVVSLPPIISPSFTQVWIEQGNPYLISYTKEEYQIVDSMGHQTTVGNNNNERIYRGVSVTPYGIAVFGNYTTCPKSIMETIFGDMGTNIGFMFIYSRVGSLLDSIQLRASISITNVALGKFPEIYGHSSKDLGDGWSERLLFGLKQIGNTVVKIDLDIPDFVSEICYG